MQNTNGKMNYYYLCLNVEYNRIIFVLLLVGPIHRIYQLKFDLVVRNNDKIENCTQTEVYNIALLLFDILHLPHCHVVT